MATSKRLATNPISMHQSRGRIAHSKPTGPLRNQFKRARHIAEARAGKFARASVHEIETEKNRRLLIALVLRAQVYRDVKNWLMRRIRGRPPLYARPDIATAYRYLRATIAPVFKPFREKLVEHGISEKTEKEVAGYLIRKLTPRKYKDGKFDIMIGELEGIPIGEHDIELE